MVGVVAEKKNDSTLVMDEDGIENVSKEKQRCWGIQTGKGIEGKNY